MVLCDKDFENLGKTFEDKHLNMLIDAAIKAITKVTGYASVNAYITILTLTEMKNLIDAHIECITDDIKLLHER